MVSSCHPRPPLICGLAGGALAPRRGHPGSAVVEGAAATDAGSIPLDRPGPRPSNVP